MQRIQLIITLIHNVSDRFHSLCSRLCYFFAKGSSFFFCNADFSGHHRSEQDDARDEFGSFFVGRKCKNQFLPQNLYSNSFPHNQPRSGCFGKGTSFFYKTLERLIAPIRKYAQQTDRGDLIQCGSYVYSCTLPHFCAVIVAAFADTIRIIRSSSATSFSERPFINAVFHSSSDAFI